MTDNSVVRRGLRHPDPRVRAASAQILDHFFDDAALAEIIDCLRDDSPRVRVWALHTPGCDRCKEGSCRPGEVVVLPEAIRMLREDPDPPCGRRPRHAWPVGGGSPVGCGASAHGRRRRRPRAPRPQGRLPFREGLTLQPPRSSHPDRSAPAPRPDLQASS